MYVNMCNLAHLRTFLSVWIRQIVRIRGQLCMRLFQSGREKLSAVHVTWINFRENGRSAGTKTNVRNIFSDFCHR